MQKAIALFIIFFIIYAKGNCTFCASLNLHQPTVEAAAGNIAWGAMKSESVSMKNYSVLMKRGSVLI